MRTARGRWIVVLLLGVTACTPGGPATTTPDPLTAPASESSSTTAAQTTTTSDVRDVSALEWVRMPLDNDGDLQRWMTAATVLDGQIIAVGAELSGPDADAAVWISADGVAWNRVPHDETVFGGDGYQIMSGVATFDGGVIAVGSDRSDGGLVGAVWVSPDGVSWTRIRSEAYFGKTDISDVARHEGLVVAVGIDFSGASGDPPEGGRVDPAVWVSADGYSWTRVASVEFESDETRWMRGVAVGASVIVAVGIAHNVGDVDGAAWISSDGYTWTPIEDEAFGGSGSQVIRRVTTTGSGFVAVGSSGVDAAIWASPDGATWLKVSNDPDMFRGTLQRQLRIESVVALQGGVVAVGLAQPVDDLEDAAIWLSDDGVTWVRIFDEALLGGPGQQIMEAIVAFNGGLVAVGRDGTGSTVSPGVWIARPPTG